MIIFFWVLFGVVALTTLTGVLLVVGRAFQPDATVGKVVIEAAKTGWELLGMWVALAFVYWLCQVYETATRAG